MSQPANTLVEHFFRHEFANLASVMTRVFGIRHIDLVEDMIQAALLEAMETWKHRGLPDNPAAWIHRVVKNRVLDALRREKTHHKAIEHAGMLLDDQEPLVDQWLDEERISDSLLRMIFVCCHPSLDRKTQIALTLKTLCGFGVSEIARGLLLPEETVKKRIQRARKELADANVPIELPGDTTLPLRVDSVHEVLYLLFNEGYSRSSGTTPICDNICEESVRLCHLLCVSPYATPATHALLALLLFHAARLDARVDERGTVVLLEDQDRSRWDRELIWSAQSCLTQSKVGRPTRFHLEASIAMLHCQAPSVEETDWNSIVHLYDRLLQCKDSPIYALNRTIALAQTGDTRQALEQLQKIRDRIEIKDYLLYDCALGKIHELEGNPESALDAYLVALTKLAAPHERELLERKMKRLGR